MPRGLLIALALLALVGGGVWYAEKHPKADDSAKKTAESPKILSVPDSQLSEIHITRVGVEPIALTKLGERWEITQPKPMSADQEAVSAMTVTVSSLTANQMVDEKPASLTPYGLDNPLDQIALKKKDGKTDTLLFGSDTPVGGNVYAKLANDPKVYTLPATAKTAFEKSLADLRDKRLLTFNQEKLTTVALAPAKGQAIEFAKNGQSDWQIVKPKTYRADNLQVDDLVRKLKDAKMDMTAPDPAKAFATAAKVATVTMTDNTGPQSIEIRKAADKSVYAKSSVVEGVYKMTGDLGDGLEKSVDDFRNKKLFDFGFSDPSKLELNGVAYDRSGEKWTSGGKQYDGPSLQSTIDKLRDFGATKFGEKMSGGQILALAVTYGDQKRVEKVLINKDGEIYEAQREGEPSIYILDPKTVTELQKLMGGIKPASAAKDATSKEQKKK